MCGAGVASALISFLYLVRRGAGHSCRTIVVARRYCRSVSGSWWLFQCSSVFTLRSPCTLPVVEFLFLVVCVLCTMSLGVSLWIGVRRRVRLRVGADLSFVEWLLAFTSHNRSVTCLHSLAGEISMQCLQFVRSVALGSGKLTPCSPLSSILCFHVFSLVSVQSAIRV